MKLTTIQEDYVYNTIKALETQFDDVMEGLKEIHGLSEESFGIINEKVALMVMDAVITEEEKLKMSIKATGRRKSDETKDKIRKTMIGENNHFYGKKHTEMAKSKVSEKNSKKVVCLETGEVFKSAAFASHCLGLNSSAVSGSIKGKSKSAGGFHWKYLEDTKK